jgi:hypothetical protein
MAALALVPPSAGADTSGGQASAYLAYRQSANTCNVWSPLFQNNADGWTTTIAIRNESTGAVTVDFRLRPLGGGTLLTRSTSIPGSSIQEIQASQFGVPDGFRGSLAGTANPCGEISAVVYQDGPGRNRITLESAEAAATDVFIPLAFNDYNGWNSSIVVQNTSRSGDASVKATYRVDGELEVEQTFTVREDSSRLIDLSTIGKGPMTVQFEGTGAASLVAAAYHLGRGGIADGNNGAAVSAGVRKIFIPLLFRRYNGYDSGVRIVNVREGGSQPRITFYDRDTDERLTTITAETTLLEGHERTWYLPDITTLADNKVYSAIIEVEPGGSDSLIAVANHVNYSRNTAMLYAGAGRGDTALAAPLVYRSASGLNSGIQVQNITGSSGSITVRFRSSNGNIVDGATRSVSVAGNNSVTIYLPSVPNLPDGFIGSADITSSVQVAATVNAVRYASPPAAPEMGA